MKFKDIFSCFRCKKKVIVPTYRVQVMLPDSAYKHLSNLSDDSTVSGINELTSTSHLADDVPIIRYCSVDSLKDLFDEDNEANDSNEDNEANDSNEDNEANDSNEDNEANNDEDRKDSKDHKDNKK